MRTHTLLCVWLLLCTLTNLTAQYQISGELKKWHKVTITFDGPATSETADVNPFTDYRLNVTFTNGNRTYLVPGYYAADGNAAESGADSGNKWRVHFTPDVTGTWTFKASFRQGDQVAISDAANAGTSASFDGVGGTFSIDRTDKTGRDHRGKGRLQYVNEHYLRYAETGEYFIKIGADAPENLLAYDDFDNTPNYGNLRKSWAPHKRDWRPGDPTWRNDKGKGIIGAINYLASEGQNAFSFLTLNINGDDDNVFPYISDDRRDRLRMDCSKLDQWEILFEHADHLGMYLHFKTQETENDRMLDGGALGPERKLYYRELIARFAHHHALNWNIGEENKNTTAQRKAFAEYFYTHDPYKNHIVLHSLPSEHDEVYTPLLGQKSKFTGPSIQTSWGNVHRATKKWREASAQAGKPWVTANDEQGGARTGVPHDGYTGFPSQDDIRNSALWGNLMAGGAGVEYYFGYDLPHSDLTCEDFRSRDRMWDYNRYAHQFFTRHLPFWRMNNHNELVGNDTDKRDKMCFADPGNVYAIYNKFGRVELDLQDYGKQPADEGAFRESEGLVIIESESGEADGGWVKKYNDGVIFYEATNNHLGNTNGGKINYDIAVSTPGIYRFQFKSNIVEGQPNSEHNDSWVKFPNDENVHFFAFKGGLSNEQTGINAVNNGNGNLFYPAGSGRSPSYGSENPGRDGYFKVYRSGSGGFKWDARTIDNNGFPIYVYFKKAGTYTMQLAERSAGHKVDRIALYKIDQHGAGQVPVALLDNSPESARDGDSATRSFRIQWYNPRTGGELQNGSVTKVTGAGPVDLGLPPSDPDKDWVVLVTAGEISCPPAGTACNDGNPDTINDTEDGNCNCEGEPKPQCPPAGTACNDGNPDTINDTEDGNCNCEGEPKPQCPPAGTACNDGNPDTINDTEDGNCNCEGEPKPQCPPAGTACEDGNPDTINDTEDGNCNCEGEPQTEAAFQLWLEAECLAVGEAWTVMSDPDASQAQYLLPPAERSLNRPPTDPKDLLEVTFEVPESGTYAIFVRAQTTNDGDDSFWVRMDDDDWIKWNKVNVDQYGNGYQWDRVGNWTGGAAADPVSFELTAGSHTLAMSWREPGIRLDKLLISDQGVAPSGKGATASNECIPGCRPAGTPCDDGDITTANDRFDDNCNCIGDPPPPLSLTWLEAECSRVGSRWRPMLDAGASNGQYLVGPDDQSTDQAPETADDLLEFSFETTIGGAYYIYARTITTGDDDDSFWVRVDDGPWIPWNKINVDTYGNNFQWEQVGKWTGGEHSQPLTFDLEAGPHNLYISWREPGVRIDKVLVSSVPLLPTGPGGDAAEQCENACPIAGTPCDDGDPATVNDVEDGLCNCAGTPPNDYWLEAECAEVGSQWTLQYNDAASNDAYLQPPNRFSYNYYPTDAEDIVRFQVTIATAGAYKIFARTMTPDQNSNSFWVRVNSGRWLRWNRINRNTTSDRFLWDQVGNWIRGEQATPMTFELSQGQNTIEFAWREPNTMLDKLYLTMDGYQPSGPGETAALCQPVVEGPQSPTPRPAPEPGRRRGDRWGLTELRAFPNPFRDQLTIQLMLPEESSREQAQLMLSDALGRVLRIIPLEAFDDSNLTLDLSGLPSGNYFLLLRQPSGTTPVKLIKIAN